MRTCAACRTRHPQGALVRVARHPNGTVSVDTGQRRTAGRGAYLCLSLACVEIAKKRRALQRALHVDVSAEVFSAISQHLAHRCHLERE